MPHQVLVTLKVLRGGQHDTMTRVIPLDLIPARNFDGLTADVGSASSITAPQHQRGFEIADLTGHASTLCLSPAFWSIQLGMWSFKKPTTSARRFAGATNGSRDRETETDDAPLRRRREDTRSAHPAVCRGCVRPRRAISHWCNQTSRSSNPVYRADRFSGSRGSRVVEHRDPRDTPIFGELHEVSSGVHLGVVLLGYPTNPKPVPEDL